MNASLSFQYSSLYSIISCHPEIYVLFNGMRKSIVRYTLTTASNDIRRIMEILRMPMIHCPSSIRAIRLHMLELTKSCHELKYRYVQDEVENNDDNVYSQHTKRIENVQF